MKFFLLLCIIALSYAGKISSRVSLEEELDEEENFEQTYHEIIEDPEEQKKHADALIAAEEEIAQHNKEYDEGKSTYKEGITELSDLPEDEFEAEKEGLIVPSDRGFFWTGAIDPPVSERNDPAAEKYFREFFTAYKMSRQSPPATYNARNSNIVSSVKNQGSCGSCAAFATTAQVESCLGQVGSLPDNLAEQEMLDCGYNPSGGANGCNGAWPASYGKWITEKNGGKLTHEYNYDYTAKLGSCQKKPAFNVGAKVSATNTKYDPTADELRALISEKGGVIGCVHANTFGNYKSGVYSGCNNDTINHAVQFVGYGTENGVDYILIKNSWGQNWGDNGYIKIKMGDCGTLHSATVLDCAGDSAAVSAPVTTLAPPPPSPKDSCDMHGYWNVGFTLDGTYNLKAKDGTDMKIECSNHVCKPLNVDYTNACIFFCGQSSCARY